MVLRRKAQCEGNGRSPCQVLERGGGTPWRRPMGWLVQRPWTAFRLLARVVAIVCEARLAMSADKPTEPVNIMLMGY